jgi:hypothetical protein
MSIQVQVARVKELGKVLTIAHKRPMLRLLYRSIKNRPEGGYVVVDFAGIDLLSFTLADEVAGELCRARIGRIILTNLNPECADTISASLRLRNEAVLAYRGTTAVILGHYPDFLLQSFNYVLEHQPVTAAQLAGDFDIKVAVAAERLRRLMEWGFVIRDTRASTRRPIFEYRIANPGMMRAATAGK